ncbi:thioredoxin [Streptomyces anulatus]|uniref:thioredoxin n=1 Tax=Streptomyces anulatus TaxID=1892 RepID=UPI00340F0297
MSGTVDEVTDEGFQGTVLEAAGPVLVHFWAEWAGPCKMMRPILEEIAAEYPAKLTVVELNIDQNPETAPTCDIDGIPAMLLFRGGTEVARRVGAHSKTQMTEFLEKYL